MLFSGLLPLSQYPGHGISKSTYSCNDPLPGKAFMYKYFPVATPGDECTSDICVCPATSTVPEWKIQQGRVYTLMSSSTSDAGRKLQQAGAGFGLHLVNVSNHLTTGGMSTAEVENQFTFKLGNMTAFDSFLDHSVLFHTSDLAGYVNKFDSDGVPYLSSEWTHENSDYTSVFVHVPNTQLTLELMQQTTLTKAKRTPVTISPLEVRASSRALEMVRTEGLATLTARGGAASAALLTPLAVNRAVSAAAMAKLDDFYVTGMGTKKVQSVSNDDVTKVCYLWTGASVDICFYQRDESQTKGDFKPADYEEMLNTVHKNIIVGHPLCGTDKWEDNHYAIDSQTAATASIVKYVEDNNVPHICQAGMPGYGTSMHYAFDPTGFGIQMDLSFASAPADCSTAAAAAALSRRELDDGDDVRLGGTFNPACDPGTCA
jgi:hypothetical protein